MKRFALLASALLAATASLADPASTKEGRDGMSLLVRFLTGTHEAIPQDEKLGSYLPIKVRFLRLWPVEEAAPPEHWLYEEVVETGEKEKVVNQRVLHFREAGGVIHAEMYDLPGDARKYAGEWRKDKPFASLKPKDLKPRSGCDVEFIQQMDILFNGGQRGDKCASRVKGAHHMRAEMYVTASTLRMWEAEFDAAGKVVAGPKNPLELRKKLAAPG